MPAVSFRARAEPLAAVAVAALGPNVRVLARQALKLSDDVLARLSGVAGPDLIVLLGPFDALPWFDGALYLGSQGGLLMPTWAEPSVHPQLLERALERGPLALIISSLDAQSAPRVVPLRDARPLSRAKLLALLA